MPVALELKSPISEVNGHVDRQTPVTILGMLVDIKAGGNPWANVSLPTSFETQFLGANAPGEGEEFVEQYPS